jgi:kumamolisin
MTTHAGKARTGIVAIVTMLLGVKIVLAQAREQFLLTRHVREVTLNGQAQRVGQLPATQSMRLDLVLGLRNRAELENFLQELYDPSSPTYRRFLTVQEFTARFGPSQKDYDAVIRFAKTNGFTVVGGSRDGMDAQLEGSVATIETAFHVTMGVYQHPTENRTFYAPDREPTVDLPFRLWHISGLDNYSIPHPNFVRKDASVKSDIGVHPNAVTGSCPGASFCGSDMRAAYYGGTALTGSGQTLGLLEYYGYDIADLNTYFTNAKQTNSVPINGISTDGTSLSCLYASGCDDTEQILDITQAVSMAPGLAALNVYVGFTDSAILSSMSTHSPLDAQLSCSWGWTPADTSTDDPYFEKFAAQGQNFFTAAGDSGPWSTSNDDWPADDAYVTSVGGTDLVTSGAGGPWRSETAWIDGGGGISPNDIAIPWWQQLTGVITASNEGSTALRNGPDVAAEAHWDFYVCADQTACTSNLYGGTSFAAPMWAGYLALVNQQVVANGGSTLGFINPAIYSLGLSSGYDAAFHDITSGSSSNGEQGYPAVTGYDLATGWGSPNGTALIKALATTSVTATPTHTATPTATPTATATPTPVPVKLTIKPASLNFGTVKVGSDKGPKNVTVSNPKGSKKKPGVTVLMEGLSGAASPFSVTNGCDAPLAPAAKCTIGVTFTPGAAQPYSATLMIIDNAENEPQPVKLTGKGKSK